MSELRAHAEHEDRFIHPLLAERAPEIVAKLDAAHVALDAEMANLSRLCDIPRAADVRQLYRCLVRFTASYLGHLACEEDEAMPALWETCSDEELSAVMAAFRQSRSPVENLTSVLAQLPTLSRPEIARMVSAGLAGTPVADLSEILGTLLGPSARGSVALI